MLTHRPDDPPGEGTDRPALRRKQMLEAFMRSVWPFNRHAEAVTLVQGDAEDETGTGKPPSA